MSSSKVFYKFSANNDLQRAATPTFPKTAPERLPPIRSEETCNSVTVTATTAASLPHKTLKSSAVQTIGRILYRLRVFPTLKDIVDEENKPPDPKKSPRLYRYFRFLGRVALCQFGKFEIMFIKLRLCTEFTIGTEFVNRNKV